MERRVACCLLFFFVFCMQFLTQGCSEKRVEKKRVSFTLMREGVAPKSGYGLPVPTEVAEVNCFGIFVSYPESAESIDNQCTDYEGQVISTPTLMLGSVALNETLYAEIVVGEDRRFQVVGFTSEDSSCPYLGWELSGEEKSLMSNPFIFGETTQSISGDGSEQSVLIEARLSEKQLIGECNGALFHWVNPPLPIISSVEPSLYAHYIAANEYILDWLDLGSDDADSSHFIYEAKLCSSTTCSLGCGEITSPVRSGITMLTDIAEDTAFYVCLRVSDLSRTEISTWVASDFPFTVDITLPTAPSGVSPGSAAFGNGSYTPSWSSGSDTNLDSYTIKACTSNDCETDCSGEVDHATSGVTAFTTGLLTDGAIYYVCAQSVDLAGNTSDFIPSVGTLTIDDNDPIAPSGVSPVGGAISIATSSYTVSWSTDGIDDNLSAHVARACTSSDCESDCTADVNPATSGVSSLSGLSNEASYSICVRAVDSAGNPSDWAVSNFTVSIDMAAPTAPSGVSPGTTIYQTATSFTPSWTDGTDDHLASHSIKACPDNGCSTSCIGLVTNATSGVSPISSLASNMSYYICVTAVDEASNASTWSASAAQVVVDITNPTSPSGVSPGGALLVTSSYTPSWNSGTDTNFSTHGIKACSGNDCTSGCGSEVTPATSGLTALAGTSDGGIYYVCARAIDLAGNGSAFVPSANTITVDDTNPTAPSGIAPSVAVHTNSTSYTSTWASGSDVNFAGHAAKACTNADCTTGCTATVDPATSGVSAISGLSNGDIYYVCVQSKDQAGNTSAWVGSGDTLTIDTINPTAPSGISPGSALYHGSTTYTPSWSDGTDASAPLVHEIKACTASDCATGCVGIQSPANSGSTGIPGLTNGISYYICVRVTDPAGNSSSWVPSINTVTIDTTLPLAANALSWNESLGVGELSLLSGNFAPPWYAVAMSASGQIQAAVAWGEYLYVSSDFGNSWRPQETASVRYWRDIALSADGVTMVAVASNAQIMVSSNSGNSWAFQDSSRDWRGVAISASGATQAAVAQGDCIYLSTDSGITWFASETSRYWTSVAISGNGTYISAATGGSSIFSSSDSGVSWMITAATNFWADVAMNESGQLQVAISTGSGVFLSTDYGASWVQSSNVTPNLQSLAISEDGMKITALASAGSIITISTNGGNDWQTTNTTRSWISVAMNSDASLQAITAFDGAMHISGDGGQQWHSKRDLGRTWQSVALSADGQLRAFVEYGGKLYLSSDAGGNWEAKSTAAFAWDSVAMSGDGHRITAVGANSIYLSTDYGSSWLQTNSGSHWISVAMSSDGMRQSAAVASSGYIYYNSNGGVGGWWQSTTPLALWNSVSMSSNGMVQAAGRNGGQIYVSTNGGVVWSARGSSMNWKSVAVSGDGSRMLAAAYGGYLYLSTDVGISWSSVLTDSSRPWKAVAISSSGKLGAAVPADGSLYLSADYGESWSAKGSNRQWLSLAFSNDESLLAAGTVRGPLVVGASSFLSSDRGVVASWVKSTSGDLDAQALQLYSDNSCTTTSGGEVSLNSSDQNYSIADTGAAGAFSFKIRSLDAAGNSLWSRCSPTLVVDETSPAAATGLFWEEGATTVLPFITASWIGSSAGDLANQKILLYNDSNCSSSEEEVNLFSLLNTTYWAFRPTLGDYSFKIKSIDKAGNETLSICSPSHITRTL
ncbi:MAG: hypothetical protein HQK50_01005 [Oligoflexia bacterium]|nr:hypothetical protein [Oligoflexia bacterium]